MQPPAPRSSTPRPWGADIGADIFHAIAPRAWRIINTPWWHAAILAALGYFAATRPITAAVLAFTLAVTWLVSGIVRARRPRRPHRPVARRRPPAAAAPAVTIPRRRAEGVPPPAEAHVAGDEYD